MRKTDGRTIIPPTHHSTADDAAECGAELCGIFSSEVVADADKKEGREKNRMKRQGKNDNARQLQIG